MTTAEVEPQEFHERFSIEYRPPSPEIADVRPAAEHTIVKDAALKVAAIVQSREGDSAPLEVRFTHTAGSKQVATKQLAGQGRLAVEQAVELQPGDNTITLSAVNAAADAADKDHERTIVVRRITFNPEATPPPDLRIDLVTADGAISHPLASDLGAPIVVDAPAVRLRGTIKADKPLVDAAWSRGDKQQALSGFQKGTQTKLEVDQPVTLEPGLQPLRVSAQSERSVGTAVSLSVDYRPRLGEVFLIAPNDGAELIEGRDARRVTISGRIGPVPEKHPFQITVLINGAPLKGSPTVDAAGETFSIEAELANGENRIEAQLSNAWVRRRMPTRFASVTFGRRRSWS